MAAASRRATTANRPTITDFLACSFSSNARQAIIATSRKAKIKVVLPNCGVPCPVPAVLANSSVAVMNLSL